VNYTFRQDVGAGGALECSDDSPLWAVAGRQGEARGRLRRRFLGDCAEVMGIRRKAGRRRRSVAINIRFQGTTAEVPPAIQEFFL